MSICTKETATHSSIPRWEIPWTQEATDHGVPKSDMTNHTHMCKSNISIKFSIVKS